MKPLPEDMQRELEAAVRWSKDRETEREIVEEVEPEWEWRPELLRWVPLKGSS